VSFLRVYFYSSSIKSSCWQKSNTIKLGLQIDPQDDQEIIIQPTLLSPFSKQQFKALELSIDQFSIMYLRSIP
jgi:hypothetical protein